MSVFFYPLIRVGVSVRKSSGKRGSEQASLHVSLFLSAHGNKTLPYGQWKPLVV